MPRPNQKKMSVGNKLLIVGIIILMVVFVALAAMTLRLRNEMHPKPPDPPVVTQTEVAPPDEQQEDPVESPSPSSNPSGEGEQEADVEEPAHTPVPTPQGGVKYLNDAVYKIGTHDNQELSIGVEGAPNDALYLNPSYLFGDRPIDRYGFYIMTDHGKIECSNSQYSSANGGVYVHTQMFMIVNRTYDTLVPAEYTDSGDYGVRWVFDPSKGVDFGTEDTLYVRAVSLETGMLMGAARVHIVYDTEKEAYKITGGESSDVMYTKEVPAEVRENVIDDLIRFFSNGTDDFTIGFHNTEDWELMRPYVTVEMVPRPYFDQLYTIDSIAVRADAFDGYTVLAVNFPFRSFGVFTAYFIPKDQVYSPSIEYQQVYVDRAGNETINQFWIVGYDALFPWSQSTFVDNLFPDDIEFFTSTPSGTN